MFRSKRKTISNLPLRMDTWLINGLAKYLGAQHLRSVFGNNEYRWRIKKDMERTCQLDVDRYPICSEEYKIPPEGEELAFIELKSPLVLHMLDVRMQTEGPQYSMMSIIREIMQSAVRGDLGDSNVLGTEKFMEMVKKHGHFSSRKFQEQWIFGSGCPLFSVNYEFNRKKMMVIFHIEQKCTNQKWVDEAEHSSKFPIFTGPMVVRIREADGVPYEHVVHITDRVLEVEVPFNTKYQRVRFNTNQGRKQHLGPDETFLEVKFPEIFGGKRTAHSVVNSWRDIKDWTMMTKKSDELHHHDMSYSDYQGDDERALDDEEGGEFENIHLDANLEWIAVFEFTQKPYMCGLQLREWDVISQLEAIKGLTRTGIEIAASDLLRAIVDPTKFYRVRMEAAIAVSKVFQIFLL